jgi:hypothetical protein
MRRLFTLLLFLFILIIAYMYFFGKGENKQNAEKIVTETRDLGRSVGDFIRRQKDNYDNGSFDSLFTKIRISLDKLKGKKGTNTEEQQQNIRELEKQLKQIDPDKLSEENREELKRLLQDLEKELD